MKHSDIYIKFMIEYDKANVTSSYPSLTQKEIATVLDKAYLALIAQKLTGNNSRQVAFEGDTKAIEDIRPLLETITSTIHDTDANVSNMYVLPLPADILYYINGYLKIIGTNVGADGKDHTFTPVSLISHTAADRFKNTSTNLPWIKNPVCYLEGECMHLLIDSFQYLKNPGTLQMSFTYVKKPEKFSDDVDQTSDTIFELSDTVVEELINLAIIMSTKIVESSRLSPEIQTKSLES